MLSTLLDGRWRARIAAGGRRLISVFLTLGLLGISAEVLAYTVARFAWVSEGGPVNFDTHGDGGGQSISYEKGRDVPQDEGELRAAFSGNHG
jgi:hypothetical protein